LSLLIFANNIPTEIKEQYSKWTDEIVLTKLKYENPLVYNRLIKIISKFISDAADSEIFKEMDT